MHGLIIIQSLQSSKSIPETNQVPQIPLSPCPYFSGSENNSEDSDSNKDEIEIPGCDEDSISESSSDDDVDNNFQSFEIITGGSERGKDMLLDGLGYKYTVHHKYPNSTTWRCTARRNKHHQNTGKPDCGATVREKDGNFSSGTNPHHCDRDQGVNIKMKIRKEVYERVDQGDTANEDTLKVIEEIILRHYKTTNKSVLPDPLLLLRSANRRRAKQFPPNPKRNDPNFDFTPYLSHKTMPKDFFETEIWVGEGTTRRRHLLFATKQQKKYLKKAVQWFIDGTFKLVAKPFMQLFSIHGFIKKNGTFKQIPLAFCLMSRREAIDYHTVLKTIKTWLGTPYSLREIVSDFEKAMWVGIKRWRTELKEKYPEITITHYGCAFHLNQAFHKKFKQLRLSKEQRTDKNIIRFVRELQCLHLLPADEIEPVFYEKKKIAPPPLMPWMHYIEKNWIKNAMWTPIVWSSYGKAIRTNNDAEGWHYRINKRGRCQNLKLSELILLLHSEAEIIPLQAALLCQGTLKRAQKESSHKIQCQIFKNWAAFKISSKTMQDSLNLLKSCTNMYLGPLAA